MAKQSTTPKISTALTTEKKATAPKKAAINLGTKKATASKKLTKSVAEKPVLRKAVKAAAAKRKTRESSFMTPGYSELTEIVTIKVPGVTVIEAYEEANLAEIDQTEQIDFDAADSDSYPAPMESRGTGPDAY